MFISKIKIKNLFGIKEYEADGKNVELIGENGTGKSSVLDAIKYALTNRSDRDYVMRQGETEGEIIIETDSGISINRKVRTDKADYKSIKENGKDVQRPEEFLKNIFTELQLNPIEFLNMSKNEQNQIVLDLIDFKWDLNWIKEQFGEVVPDVEWDQNILRVLHEIQSEDGYYFKTRQEINRTARNKKAIVEDIAHEIPAKYNVEYWEAFDLGDMYKKIEKIKYENNEIEKARLMLESRDNKIRSFEADFEIIKSSCEKQATLTRQSNLDAINEYTQRIKELEVQNQSLEETKIKDIKLAQAEFETKKAKFDGDIIETRKIAVKKLGGFDEIQKEVDQAEQMKKHINEYKRMVDYQKQIEKLIQESETYTEKISHARMLPAQILETANIPVKNLSVKDGVPLINNLPISNLSEGEKLLLCVDIAVQNPNSLNILLIDGIETLSKKNREALYKILKKKGVQWLSTRTTDDNDLIVIEL